MPRSWIRPHRSVVGVLVLVLTASVSMLGAFAATTSSAAASTTGTLRVNPGRYLPGQEIRLTGKLGNTARLVHLQGHMNRPGDRWVDKANTEFRTARDGSFDFVTQAPAMVDLSYRVIGGGLATPGYVFNASPQELTVTPPGQSAHYPFYSVRARAQYTVDVDTTPPVTGKWRVAPPIPGRTVLLQQRVEGGQWRNLDSAPTDASGNVRFTVTAPASGTQVLRARQERWTAGANRIGWFASFPATFVVSDGPRGTSPPSRRVNEGAWSTSPRRPTAGGRFRWGAMRSDFGWEGGNDLDSPPSKGAVRTGRWTSASDGTGRAIAFNGGLVLQTKLKRKGPGDRGSVAALLTGESQAHGRWEMRLQGRRWEAGARKYRFVVELVPEGSPALGCVRDSITVAEFTMNSRGMRYGVRASGTAWQKTLASEILGRKPFNVAVEVGQGHITWFRESKPIGTVKDPRAQLGVRLVPRMSLLGAAEEMDGAQVNSDWQRSWTLRSGTQVTNAPKLGRVAYTGC